MLTNARSYFLNISYSIVYQRHDKAYLHMLMTKMKNGLSGDAIALLQDIVNMHE